MDKYADVIGYIQIIVAVNLLLLVDIYVAPESLVWTGPYAGLVSGYFGARILLYYWYLPRKHISPTTNVGEVIPPASNFKALFELKD